MYEPVRYNSLPGTQANVDSTSMPPRAAPERTRDRDRTRAEILAVATEEFSEHGYSGARVDEIAERTRTTKRMLYYYFESKEGLYAEVLKTRVRGDPRARSRRSTSSTSTPSPPSAASPS